MTRNVTLRLDEAVLRKARHAAVEEDQSLSEWVTRQILDSLSRRERLSKARRRALQRLDNGFRLGGRPLNRDEVHER